MNPFGFTPLPVATLITIVYAVLFSVLVSFHNVVPDAPSSPTPKTGINLTEAWHDLQVLTNGYHPYNSHRNDEVREWLLHRIEAILHRNNATGNHITVLPHGKDARQAVIFDDITSNLTFGSNDSSLTVAFTGTNIIVYIPGSEDTSDLPKKGGVLVNAHFDSVPSGFGATDDGVGVITVLQLISYFSHPQNTPKRGVVALLNNGEEDYLNGAYAFSQHPISSFPHTFLNLEGAGAGGRAVLFRSTDTQVTKFYKKAPHPFGTVISADGFKRGLVRSQTDYVVFNGELGMRGLDVAFMEPRSRYHTQEDSTKYTSMNSLWHMLSSSIATMEGLTSDTSSEFDGPPAGPGKVSSGSGSDSVWFDLFGRVFVVFELHSLFAVSVTLLVVTPLCLAGLTLILIKLDKWYPFTSFKSVEGSEERIPINGWRSIFRIPLVYAFATAAIVGLAFLIVKINPYIIYSSQYSVWSMMLSAWFFFVWFLLRGADSVRPSALQRMNTLLWIYIAAWILLVGVTVLENNFGLAGGYFLVFYFGVVFIALVISYLELLALPTKSKYAKLVAPDYDTSSVTGQAPSTSASHGAPSSTEEHEDDDADETESLLRNDRTRRLGRGYDTMNRRSESLDYDARAQRFLPRPYEHEQAWSGGLPNWTWLLQFLILGPIPIILCTQVALLQTSALHQTPADGSPVLTVYIFIVLLTVLLLAPVTPFIHRLTVFLPTILFLVFVGTLTYNLLAFPFSDDARLKVYFLQSVNLDTGINKVSLTGLPSYTDKIIASIPSSAGQHINCSLPEYTARSGLHKCTWSGPPPNVLLEPPSRKHLPAPSAYGKWMNLTTTRLNTTKSSARFVLSGANTRACRLLFDSPISNLSVQGYATDPRFPSVGSKGCTSIRLWTREWGGSWNVTVEWEGSGGLDGRAVCLWSDANDPAAIPAYTEVLRFMPRWSQVTKLSDGLVEGWKEFKI